MATNIPPRVTPLPQEVQTPETQLNQLLAQLGLPTRPIQSVPRPAGLPLSLPGVIGPAPDYPAAPAPPPHSSPTDVPPSFHGGSPFGAPMMSQTEHAAMPENFGSVFNPLPSSADMFGQPGNSVMAPPIPAPAVAPASPHQASTESMNVIRVGGQPAAAPPLPASIGDSTASNQPHSPSEYTGNPFTPPAPAVGPGGQTPNPVGPAGGVDPNLREIGGLLSQAKGIHPGTRAAEDARTGASDPWRNGTFKPIDPRIAQASQGPTAANQWANLFAPAGQPNPTGAYGRIR
jgi:hypothetical protein